MNELRPTAPPPTPIDGHRRDGGGGGGRWSRLTSLELHKAMVCVPATVHFTEYLCQSSSFFLELDGYVLFDFMGRMFAPILTFCFGMNLYMFRTKCIANGQAESTITAAIMRRALIFFVIGVAFNCAIWGQAHAFDADILVFYSLAGMLMLLIWRLPVPALTCVCVLVLLVAQWLNRNYVSHFDVWERVDFDEWGEKLNARSLRCVEYKCPRAMSLCRPDTPCGQWWSCLSNCVSTNRTHTDTCVSVCSTHLRNMQRWYDERVRMSAASYANIHNNNNYDDGDEMSIIINAIRSDISTAFGRRVLRDMHTTGSSIQELIEEEQLSEAALLDVYPELPVESRTWRHHRERIMTAVNISEWYGYSLLPVVAHISQWIAVNDPQQFPLETLAHEFSVGYQHLRAWPFAVYSKTRYRTNTLNEERVQKTTNDGNESNDDDDAEEGEEEDEEVHIKLRDRGVVAVQDCAVHERCVMYERIHDVDASYNDPDPTITWSSVFWSLMLEGHFTIMPYIFFPLCGYLTAKIFTTWQSRQRETTLRRAGLLVYAYVVVDVVYRWLYRTKVERQDTWVGFFDTNFRPYPTASYLYLVTGVASNWLFMAMFEKYNRQPLDASSSPILGRLAPHMFYVSRYLMTFYVGQHFATVLPLRLYSWLRYGDQWLVYEAKSVPISWGIAAGYAYTVATTQIFRVWEQKYDAKYTLEWVVRAFTNPPPTKQKTDKTK